MNAYHRLVGEQLADVDKAREPYHPAKPIIEHKKVRFSRIKMTLKRAAKWLKGGV